MDNKLKQYLNNIECLTNVPCELFYIKNRNFENSSNYCNTICKNLCDFGKTHLYGCYEAQRWDGKYIYYCPRGFIFSTVIIYNELGLAENGIVSGPIQMGNPEDFELEKGVSQLSTSQVQALSELMSTLFNKEDKPKPVQKTNDFLNTVYSVLEERQDLGSYPISLEKELQQAISAGDADQSKDLLNRLLGHIFFHSNSDLEKIKTRVLELMVLLSRSAIEGGAEPEPIFALNSDYIKDVENFDSIEKISVWFSEIIDRFISYVFDFGNIKHINTIYKTTAFIKDNYMKKLTLEQIANNVYMSPSYLSHIFKEEMQCSLTDYINTIRIGKSKELLQNRSLSLAEVSLMVGFDDQSYFTKIFKRITGYSPGKFREKIIS